jgi:hypothetical protein
VKKLIFKEQILIHFELKLLKIFEYDKKNVIERMNKESKQITSKKYKTT